MLLVLYCILRDACSYNDISVYVCIQQHHQLLYHLEVVTNNAYRLPFSFSRHDERTPSGSSLRRRALTDGKFDAKKRRSKNPWAVDGAKKDVILNGEIAEI